MITYEIPRPCYRCLCRVCGQAGCPHWNGRYRKRCNDCWYSHDFRPILDCENFYFKFFKRYRIRRVYRRPKVRYVDKTNADDIRVMLTEILELLRSGSSSSPMNDPNCIRHDCLCLRCAYFSMCKERCAFCTEYKGQHPVKMCGLKLQRDIYL
ncbi:MAG: hypothetical protein NC299_09740 [Lachnospiraceae bacterium]|nr:hypothetical protein [Ruminococcus sp.]MCM1275635.1 hypothetical protein [Lachnospiraceae bacterium]